jgi:hypothetical protein
MANEDDSVTSFSFAIFIWVSVSDFIFHIPGETLEHGFYPEMEHRCAFSQKRICIYQKSASFIYCVSGTKNS